MLVAVDFDVAPVVLEGYLLILIIFLLLVG